jgi:DNA-binding response OmpR family regulator
MKLFNDFLDSFYGRGGPMRVLLVEDDPDVATTISILFEIKFHKATMFSTHSGEKALELIQNHEPLA